MGIRCTCPNGHKLHLKAFLGGKKGICPRCEARFRIPLATSSEVVGNASSARGRSSADAPPSQSTAVLDIPETDQHRESDPADDIDFGSPDLLNIALLDSEPKSIDRAEKTSPHDVASHFEAAESLEHATAPSFKGVDSGAASTPTTDAQPEPSELHHDSAGQALVQPPPRPARTSSDPFEEAPGAMWYVRPPSGGQYGPARAEVFRQWIAEGRVSGDSHIWREGWSDWQAASTHFPDLPFSSAAPADAAMAAMTGAPDIQVQVDRPARPLPVARVTSRIPARRNLLVVALTILSILLLTGLAYVVSRGT